MSLIRLWFAQSSSQNSELNIMIDFENQNHLKYIAKFIIKSVYSDKIYYNYTGINSILACIMLSLRFRYANHYFMINKFLGFFIFFDKLNLHNKFWYNR